MKLDQRADSHTNTGIGAPVRRFEDQRFLTGRGNFVDDLSAERMAFAHVVRSPHAHARIIRIDKASALAAPGVLTVLTADDVAAQNIGALKCQGFPQLPKDAPHYRPVRPLLASGVVRHVGDCVALVVAETLNQAKDAGELLHVDYEPLSAVTLADAGA